ncbi:hypothetical protein [Streptomyces sp. NL15-2K]|uniref:hypothetical protein n=1 Tax=Streptomyces sp. NL15-2K TaxID=376149 RepID=UPI000F586FA8|nr:MULTISPECIES: hypothetical protein [Actinomycetes]WKX14188.1 hypothetical protein Q4V64_44395 [Kutzneria buriramensis]
MEDRLETGSELHRLNEEVEDIGKGQTRHEGRLGDFEDELLGVRADVVRLGSEVSEVRQEIEGLEGTVSGTRQMLDTFIEQYGRDREVAKAQAELSRLTTQWHADFGQRKQTRALARGLVHTLTAHAVYRTVVSSAAVRACTEERMLLEPTYWLAPAAMAVAAKFRDEGERGESAQAHARMLDAAKADLFFSLTCSRFGDETQAAAWMDMYLQSLDPQELGQDFFVVLDAIASKELGDEALGYAQRAMAGWNRSILQFPGEKHAFADVRGGEQWKTRLENLRRRMAKKQYSALRRTSGNQWDGLRLGWELATVPDQTLAYLVHMFPDGPDGVDWPIKDGRYVDRALERLINQLEPDEADLRAKMRRLEQVIAHDGDLEAVGQAHESPFSPDADPVTFMTLLDQAVFEPDEARLGPPARRMALRAIWPTLENAANRIVAESRQHLPQSITLSIADWSCTVSTDPELFLDPDPLLRDLAAHITRQTQVQSEAVVRRWPRVCGALAMGGVSGLLVVPFVDETWRGFFTLLAIGMVAWGVWEICGVPRRRKQVHEQGDRLRNDSVATLAKALAQGKDFFEEWHEAMEGLSDLTSWGGHPNSN